MCLWCVLGPFEVWNEANEEATLRRWFDHMQQVGSNSFHFPGWSPIGILQYKTKISPLHQGRNVMPLFSQHQTLDLHTPTHYKPS